MYFNCIAHLNIYTWNLRITKFVIVIIIIIIIKTLVVVSCCVVVSLLAIQREGIEELQSCWAFEIFHHGSRMLRSFLLLLK